MRLSQLRLSSNAAVFSATGVEVISVTLIKLDGIEGARRSKLQVRDAVALWQHRNGASVWVMAS